MTIIVVEHGVVLSSLVVFRFVISCYMVEKTRRQTRMKSQFPVHP